MRRRLLLASPLALALPARAHHSWSGFDQTRPLYLEGKAVQVRWRNPHAEVEIELPAAGLALPAGLAARALPAQTAPVNGRALLKAARLPTRQDKLWVIELAPMFRMLAWKVAEIKPGDELAFLGFTAPGETGAALLRAEYLFVGDKTYGLRSSPA